MERNTTNGQPITTHLAYAPVARAFHWATLALVVILVPLGLYMSWRGNATNFDVTTGRLYDLHKLLGFLTLWVVIARLTFRIRNGAPPDEPTLEPWQKAASHMTHWGLYALLLTIPVLGWVGVSYYDARSIFGIFNLPALAGKNESAANTAFMLHYWAAMLMVAMVAMHVGAALFHHLVRGDGVLRRMLPGLRQR